MESIQTNSPGNADVDAVIASAIEALASGELVAFPTETVYGLGADATNDLAVAKIFDAKGRPSFNPLISHVADMSLAEALAVFSTDAHKLADRFWPGPLTLVLPRTRTCTVSYLATAGLDTIAVRMPANEIAKKLLSGFGKPVAAPSANTSGRVSSTTAAHVLSDLGQAVRVIVDGGPTKIGLESTIVGFDNETPLLLRSGGLARAEIENVLGRPLRDHTTPGSTPNAPGQLASHYAPHAGLRLNAEAAQDTEALLAFGPSVPAHSGPSLNLSPSGDLIEAAANLFAYMRKLDSSQVDAIAVMTIPAEGLGEAINDRLARAAAPR